MTLPLTLAPLLPEESLSTGGADWNLCSIVRVVDGDTVRLYRSQLTWRRTVDEEVGGSLRRERWVVEVIRDDVDELPGGLAGRLVNLNTPERGKPGFAEATAELAGWCQRHAGRLRCITYDRGGGFDRLLTDVYVLAEDGATVADSASQHMLRAGWPPYVG